MQTDNPFIDDLSKLATGLVGTLDSMKKECDGLVRARIERLASEFDLVPREDFEVLKDRFNKMTVENKALNARLEALEKNSKGKK
ncbi:MAG: accessory factor UbiK family protein [Sphingomonadales bacterium]